MPFDVYSQTGADAAFATAAQGAKADTAVQPADLTSYATAAQGTTADSAVQPGDDAADLGSAAANDGYVLTADGAGGAAWSSLPASDGGEPDAAPLPITLRRGTSAEWADANPILSAGEPGVDLDTGDLRVGDGVTAWSELPTKADRAKVQPTWLLAGTGIDPTGLTDSTAALTARFNAGLAAGATHFAGEAGAVYKVAIPDGGWLFRLTSAAKGVTIDLSGCTLDNSATSYITDTTFTSVLLIDGARDTTFLLRDYIGYTLPTPASHLGYRGATLVRAINGADGVKVHARATNLRYGVQSGEYGDATKGACRNFDVKLRGSMIGYGVALYRSSGVRHDLDIDGIHRVAYIAGCDDVTGVARWRDQYVAPIAYLITDALTSGTDAAAQADPVGAATTSRGCTNIDVTSIDKGSTVFQPATVCAGISLSRIDPCQFENIRVKVYTVGTDTVSTVVGGFWIVSSGVPAIWSRYTHNWEPTVILDNITITGVVDHSAQTLPSNSTGELYIYTKDDTGEGSGKYATVRHLKVDDLTILKSAAVSPRAVYVVVREPAIPITLRGLHAPGVGLALNTSATMPTQVDNCTFAMVTTAGTVASLLSMGQGNKIDTLTGSTPNRAASQGIGGAGAVVMQKETTLTLTGASVTWSAAIPGGSILLGVQGRVQTTITGASGAQVGVTGDLTRFRNGDFTAVGATIGPSQQAVTEVSPKWYLTNTDIIVTARTSNFTGGTLRLIVNYITFTAPTA